SDVVPPFYMFSFELGGIARSDFLGSDAQNLTWTVRHSQGACNTICDRQGQSSDIITQVATCDDLTLAITGGVKPYTVSVLGLNFTNFTLGTENDEFKYLNQDTPGDSFI
ncbi:uncharacterized protein FOMMEDRAFT_69934, partial [Fomitiporia mediterranea MF3/22]|uniref:uncharacterized protein n=1 Tax=Fomitiporia mediterranea (strain MF3/22) TaxID=694068 RepID=UPI00044081DC